MFFLIFEKRLIDLIQSLQVNQLFGIQMLSQKYFDVVISLTCSKNIYNENVKKNIEKWVVFQKSTYKCNIFETSRI